MCPFPHVLFLYTFSSTVFTWWPLVFFNDLDSTFSSPKFFYPGEILPALLYVKIQVSCEHVGGNTLIIYTIFFLYLVHTAWTGFYHLTDAKQVCFWLNCLGATTLSSLWPLRISLNILNELRYPVNILKRTVFHAKVFLRNRVCKNWVMLNNLKVTR